VIVTDTEGMPPPVLSVTVPDIVAFVWARMAAGLTRKRISAQAAVYRDRMAKRLPEFPTEPVNEKAEAVFQNNIAASLTMAPARITGVAVPEILPVTPHAIPVAKPAANRINAATLKK
jgi:hypothetical protein